MTGRSGSKGTFGIPLPDPPGQRLWLNIKVQDHSKTKKKKNQDHSKAHELPKSSNDTNVVWPRGKGPKTPTEKPEAEKDSPRGRHLGGPWAEEPNTESQGPCIVTYSPPSASRVPPQGSEKKLLPCPAQTGVFRAFQLHVLDIWLEAWQSRCRGEEDSGQIPEAKC